ncbi:MAG: hypothetical protein FK734_07890, partial [Asgard group archaeon]|nr:hypothetical protein [Asgard group archaeon]
MKIAKLYSVLLMILCLQSLLYLTNIGGDLVEETTIDSPVEEMQQSPILDDEIGNIEPQAIVNDTITTPGNYKLQGYFTQNSFVDLDANGYVFEWERYEDLGPVADYYNVNFRQYTPSSYPEIFWHTLGEFGQLRSYDLVNGEHIYSTIFTPVFTADTYIQGKVYFMVMGDVWPSTYNRWTLKMTLELFNPATEVATYIIHTQGLLDDGKYVYSVTLPNKVLIPEGYRLRTTYTVRLEPSTYVSGRENSVEIHTGSYTYACSWTINDANDTFDHSYTFENNIETIGMQLYMYKTSYPTIDITGYTNNTIYYSAQNATITTSSDAITNRYKWDAGSFIGFTSPKVVYLPTTTIGLHTLTVESEDDYGNINKAIYQLYYDPSEINVILNSPANNSVVTDGEILDFSVASDVTFATYEWDKDTIQILFLSPHDIILNKGFSGIHQLTIHTTDYYGTELFEYFFDFDNSAPTIALKSLTNETTQPQGKSIDVQITDKSTPLSVQYKWDSDSFVTWTPIEGNTYRTYLPITAGWHYLTIMANDSFDHSATKLFAFNTSLSLLLVQLNNLINNTY